MGEWESESEGERMSRASDTHATSVIVLPRRAMIYPEFTRLVTCGALRKAKGASMTGWQLRSGDCMLSSDGVVCISCCSALL